jgi:hypothetical protein
MCLLPGEAGSVEIAQAVNLKDISGKWYDVLIDKDAWGASNPICSETIISLAPGSKESVSQSNENLSFKRSDFKS